MTALPNALKAQPPKGTNTRLISNLLLLAKYSLLIFQFFNPFPVMTIPTRIITQCLTTVNTTEPYAIPGAAILFTEVFLSFGFNIAFIVALVCQLTFYFLNTGVGCGFNYFNRKLSFLVLAMAIPLSFNFGLDSNLFVQIFFVCGSFNVACVIETYFAGYVGLQEVTGAFIHLISVIMQLFGYKNLWCFAVGILAQDLMLV
ncbi:Transmembrane domain-containing protein [Spironucleus salmonicida]|uniref:Transmembrane domain-containing protein n=1 Tax=Spironucleus salmonicida TaxID=348837 RepID=V6LW06_9EUKA|nr:Transmembrane domain-containing protein [Spironucleus salmonicida]|eukprot:EST48745.1 Transmembrane domain-containing protein [Spironucleus salmonicida]